MPDEINGRVTNAILATKQEHIIEMLEKQERKLDEFSVELARRVSLIEMKQAIHSEKISHIATWSSIRDGLNFLGAAIGTFFGIRQ